jgi:hypothetical protein
MSDNAMISVYPFGDELYAFTEFPVIHRFDLKTLDTVERVSEKTVSHVKQRLAFLYPATSHLTLVRVVAENLQMLIQAGSVWMA